MLPYVIYNTLSAQILQNKMDIIPSQFEHLFHSQVPAKCNHTSCANKHELLQDYSGDSPMGTLLSSTDCK